MLGKLKIKVRRLSHRCVSCGSKKAPWIWAYQGGGEAHLCDWHNSQMQAETRLHPLRRES